MCKNTNIYLYFLRTYYHVQDTIQNTFLKDNKHVMGGELTLKNGCLLSSSASSSPPPKRFRGSFTNSFEMKSATSADKSSGMGGFVISIRLKKRILLLILPLLSIHNYCLKRYPNFKQYKNSQLYAYWYPSTLVLPCIHRVI